MTGQARGFVRDNALSLAFGAMFVVTLVGQALTGAADFNAQQVANGLEPVSLTDYVTSSSFGVITGQANAPRQLQLGFKLLW